MELCLRKILRRQDPCHRIGPVPLSRQAGKEPARRLHRSVADAQGGAPVGEDTLWRGLQLPRLPALSQQDAILQSGHSAVGHPNQGPRQIVQLRPLGGLPINMQPIPHQRGLDAAHPAVETPHARLRVGLQIRPAQL